ncbi:ABC transporter permease [Mucilaginibacter sp. PPCGB 2223]|uniref:ABC transporter permease n=1 Tax=Mucilaginibacter sp. PPCGB 2223 TaxID=1886027 RepID=UPI000824218D|nr:ABC transporter permease [Mucilaginibacter sp. PPCGB 2223]OCX52189.1 ABC transporter permease [Mucilaginibacter sp. PPCGB 2223]
MLRNYIKIALRNLSRHKAYSVINVLGLAIGIASCLLLYIVVRYENSYDTFQPNYSRIMHVVTADKFPDGMVYNSGVPFPMADALRADYPSIKTGAIFASPGSQVTVLNSNKNDNKFIERNGLFYCEPQFFEVFQYNFLAGNAKVLAEPNTVLLSKDMAVKYFGDWKTAIGRLLRIDNALTLKVSAIIDNVPGHSDFPLKIVGSFAAMKTAAATYGYEPTWFGMTSNYQVFMLLPPGITQAAIETQLKQSNVKFYGAHAYTKRTHLLQPLSDIHFDTDFSNFGDHITSKSKLLTLTLIGVLIIVMACINFVNLSTAKAVTRSREVGVRKVLGSSRKQLFWQMMGETALMVFIATALALLIAALALPYIKNIMTIQETLSILRTDILLFVLAGIIVVTFLSGIYPSLILSGFTPALALKNKITSATVGGISLRRGLVITQFAISQVLIIGTIVAVSQMDFISKADLGFNKDAVLVLNANTDSAAISRQAAFKQRLLQLPGVQSVTFSSDVPQSDNDWQTNFSYDHRPDEKYSIDLKFADPDYFKTFGLRFLAGRPFALADTINEVVVNQTLLAKLHVAKPADAIGKQIRIGTAPWKNIVGVVQDFKTNSLRESVKPVFISTRKKYYSVTSVKLHSANVLQAPQAIQAEWNKFFPEYANTASFLDKSIENYYQQEGQLSLVYKIFAALAIFISCLGLYGLVSFMAVQKTKEVGIRKVLGAGVGHIIYLFSKEFTLLILAAFIVAAPVAYFLMHNWLENFVFRIDIGAGVFAAAILTSVIIAWLTVGFKAVKAAYVNPVKSLKSE